MLGILSISIHWFFSMFCIFILKIFQFSEYVVQYTMKLNYKGKYCIVYVNRVELENNEKCFSFLSNEGEGKDLRQIFEAIHF